jgi:hypothetical protein
MDEGGRVSGYLGVRVLRMDSVRIIRYAFRRGVKRDRGRRMNSQSPSPASCCPDVPSPFVHPRRALRPTGRSIRERGVLLPRRDVALTSVARMRRFTAGPVASNGKTHRTQVKSGVDRGFQGGVCPGCALVEADFHPKDAAIAGGGYPSGDCRTGGNLLSGAGVSMRPQIW